MYNPEAASTFSCNTDYIYLAILNNMYYTTQLSESVTTGLSVDIKQDEI